MERRTKDLLPGQKAVMGEQQIELEQILYSSWIDDTGKWKNYDFFLEAKTSDINQDLFDPTLFIGRDPYQVRSLADSAVEYKFDKEANRVEIKLRNPELKPEDDFDSLLPGTVHKLCLNCRDVLNYLGRYREQQVKVSFMWPNVPNIASFDLAETVD